MTGERFGHGSFTLLLNSPLYANLKKTIELNPTWITIDGEYSLKKENETYFFVQITIIDYHKSAKSIFKDVYEKIPFMAIHPSDSLYIFSYTPSLFKKALISIYGEKGNKNMFFYDMLSIQERYVSIISCLPTSIYKNKNFLQFHYYNQDNGSYYKLDLTRDSKQLFQADSDIELFDIISDERIEVDGLDGLNLFSFCVAILDKKS